MNSAIYITSILADIAISVLSFMLINNRINDIALLSYCFYFGTTLYFLSKTSNKKLYRCKKSIMYFTFPIILVAYLWGDTSAFSILTSLFFLFSDGKIDFSIIFLCILGVGILFEIIYAIEDNDYEEKGRTLKFLFYGIIIACFILLISFLNYEI